MKRVTVLTGGVGGAKLVLGLAAACPDDDITAVVNTGDDFEHYGLYISPDIDTLLYTLSGKANEQLGWGRKDESWNFMAALGSLGGEAWFNLGDGDLALHVLRSWRLGRGESLSSIVSDFAKSWDISVSVLPMSNAPVRTMISTDRGRMDFQRYFVEQKCAPRISGIDFDGADQGDAGPGVVEAVMNADAVIIAPSNPFLSIDPILAVKPILKALTATKAPVVAVSPIIGGKAVKGPTAKIMRELNYTPDNAAISRHYEGVIDGLVIDRNDSPPDGGVAIRKTQTLMLTLDDRRRVAEAALALAAEIAKS